MYSLKSAYNLVPFYCSLYSSDNSKIHGTKLKTCLKTQRGTHAGLVETNCNQQNKYLYIIAWFLEEAELKPFLLHFILKLQH